MPMVFDRRQLRRWAARLLLAWLLGVAAGVAHACIVGPSVDAAAPAVHDDAAAGHAQPGHDDDQGARDACRDFCEKSALRVPGTPSFWDLHAAVLPAAPVLSPPRPVPAAAAFPDRSGRRSTWPPIRIAFMRLAL